jgi:hypothetical protein
MRSAGKIPLVRAIALVPARFALTACGGSGSGESRYDVKTRRLAQCSRSVSKSTYPEV